MPKKGITMLLLFFVFIYCTDVSAFNRKFNHEAGNCWDTLDIEEKFISGTGTTPLTVLTTLKESPSCRDHCAHTLKTVSVTSARLVRFLRSMQPSNLDLLPTEDNTVPPGWGVLTPPGNVSNGLTVSPTMLGPITGWNLTPSYLTMNGTPDLSAYLFAVRLSVTATHMCDGRDCGCAPGPHTISMECYIQVNSGASADRTLNLAYSVTNGGKAHSVTNDTPFCTGASQGDLSYNATAFSSNAEIMNNFNNKGYQNEFTVHDTVYWQHNFQWGNPPANPVPPDDPAEPVTVSGAEEPDNKCWQGTGYIRDHHGTMTTSGQNAANMTHHFNGARWVWDNIHHLWLRESLGCN